MELETVKHTLAVVGLSCDLLGAFLLSVTIIWNISSFIDLLDTQKAILIKGVAKIKREEGKLSSKVKVLTLILFLEGLFFGGSAIYLLYQPLKRMVGTEGVVATFVGYSIGMFVGLGFLFFLYIATKAFLHWVRAGAHERRIGIVGFIILCLGFIMQTISVLIA